MAVTNINNLDGLNAVPGFTADDETLVKAIVTEVLFHGNFRALSGLFVGQMAAEGFIDIDVGELRATLESPTIQIRFYDTGVGKTQVNVYELVSAAWVLRMELEYDGSFSSYVTP
jgi:hypothetical protein